MNAGSAGTAMGYGLKYMKTVSVFYVLMGFMFVGNGLLRGAGDMGAFMLSSISVSYTHLDVYKRQDLLSECFREYRMPG